ncbi:hypothetical protein [Parasediminibacterium sp. JCM 36343]|uniref:hypothetical protein n=1 Tax=Parasediminibacterium sp. JCM 36343 TaxID=3374279 RepID=UPI00397CFAB1
MNKNSTKSIGYRFKKNLQAKESKSFEDKLLFATLCIACKGQLDIKNDYSIRISNDELIDHDGSLLCIN